MVFMVLLYYLCVAIFVSPLAVACDLAVGAALAWLWG